MDEQRQKRKEIFENYKENIKKAKFAPLSKYALNMGNPAISNKQNQDDTQVNKNVDEVFVAYKIKKLEEKINKIYVMSILALILSLLSAIFVLYNP